MEAVTEVVAEPMVLEVANSGWIMRFCGGRGAALVCPFLAIASTLGWNWQDGGVIGLPIEVCKKKEKSN